MARPYLFCQAGFEFFDHRGNADHRGGRGLSLQGGQRTMISLFRHLLRQSVHERALYAVHTMMRDERLPSGERLHRAIAALDHVSHVMPSTGRGVQAASIAARLLRASTGSSRSPA